MRKMKKINGFLVVRFNDREKRENPTLGSFGSTSSSRASAAVSAMTV